METLGQKIALELVRAGNRITDAECLRSQGGEIGAGEQADLSRILDGLAERAIMLRGRIEHPGDDRDSSNRRNRLIRRVRKALGYTYP